MRYIESKRERAESATVFSYILIDIISITSWSRWPKRCPRSVLLRLSFVWLLLRSADAAG